MVFFDFVIICLLLYGFIKGIWDGFFVAFASFISLIVGIYVAIKFSYLIKETLANHVSWSSKTVLIAAFVITVALVVIGISILAKFFTTVADFASLGIINKFAGGIFGVLKMILILSILFNVLQKINTNHIIVKKETLDKSIVYNPIVKVGAFIYPSIEDLFKNLKSKPVD